MRRTKGSAPVRRKNRGAPVGDQAREVLAERLIRLRRPVRSIERELGWSQASLTHLLNGHAEVKLRHIEALAPVFGVTPRELCNEIFGEGVGQAEAAALRRPCFDFTDP